MIVTMLHPLMKRHLLTLMLSAGIFFQSFRSAEVPVSVNNTAHGALVASVCYEEITWKGDRPSIKAFDLAYKGYLKLLEEGKIANQRYLTIVDFSLSANKKRLWTIDLNDNSLVFHELVAHGMGTGEEYAKHFSNQPESHKSSLGFYTTGEIYLGKHQESLRLHGLERGFNDKALERGIVIHAANYVQESFIRDHKRLGRSHGCPAVRPEINLPLIKTIQGGSLVFIYFPDQQYLKQSPVLRG